MNYPYTFSDVFFQLVRLGLLGGLIFFGYTQLVAYRYDIEVTTWFWQDVFAALAAGSIVYVLILRLFNGLMWVVFKCEALGAHDYSFLLDEQHNQHIIIGVGIFEKFDYISMKQYMLEKANKLDKCQSKLVKKFGLFWFQKLTDEEWKTQQKNVVRLEQNITSDQELKDFVTKEQSTYDFYDMP